MKAGEDKVRNQSKRGIGSLVKDIFRSGPRNRGTARTDLNYELGWALCAFHAQPVEGWGSSEPLKRRGQLPPTNRPGPLAGSTNTPPHPALHPSHTPPKPPHP